MDTNSSPEHTTTLDFDTRVVDTHGGSELALAVLVESLAALRVHNSGTDVDALIECIGQLNLAGIDSCHCNTAFDMHALLDALPVAIAAEDDLTELFIRLLDRAMDAGAEREEQDDEDASSVDGDDDWPANTSRSFIPADLATDYFPTCVDPKEIFPPPPREMDWSECDSSDESGSECSTPADSDDESVATTYSTATTSSHFNLKRRYDEYDLESSDSEDEYAVKRRRCVVLPRRVRQHRGKYRTVRMMPMAVSPLSSGPDSSDDESYFSDTIHAARPMSPIDGEIANNIAMYCNLVFHSCVSVVTSD